jgi:hypothetical protein
MTAAEVVRLVELGILVARDGAEPFLEVHVPKVRLAVRCEQAGLPMERITAAIAARRLSFAFPEGATSESGWCARGGPTTRRLLGTSRTLHAMWYEAVPAKDVPRSRQKGRSPSCLDSCIVRNRLASC